VHGTQLQTFFLSYVIDYLRMQGVQRFIFSLGQAEVIQQHLMEEYPHCNTPVL